MLRKLSVGLLAASLFAPAVAGAASSSKTKTVKTSGSVIGAIAGKLVVAGYDTDEVSGKGAVLFNDVKAGMGQTTPFTVFFANGSITGVSKFDSVLNADGTITISNGTLTVKSGTGTSKAATGTGTVSGSADAMDHFTLRYTLTLKERR